MWDKVDLLVFVCGFFAGGFLGMVLMGALTMAKDDDDEKINRINNR